MRKLLVIAVLLAALAAPLAAQQALAQAPAPEPAASAAPAVDPCVVKVGMYILNLGNFNLNTGSYTVDFYLSMKSDKPFPEGVPGNFEFMNGRAASMDKIVDEPMEKFYRIQANLSQNIDFKRYPFDRHSLGIVLEDKTNTTSAVRYEMDDSQSGIDPSVIVVGWQLKGWKGSTDEHFYEPYAEKYSRLSFNVDISRVMLTSFIKSLLPVFFMVFVGILSLLFTADKVQLRLSLNISTLLGAVMFHLNLTSSIPPVGYLTFADKFMIITYLSLIAILFSGVLLMRHSDMKDSAKADKIYKTSLVTLPIVIVGIYVMGFLVF